MNIIDLFRYKYLIINSIKGLEVAVDYEEVVKVYKKLLGVGLNFRLSMDEDIFVWNTENSRYYLRFKSNKGVVEKVEYFDNNLYLKELKFKDSKVIRDERVIRRYPNHFNEFSLKMDIVYNQLNNQDLCETQGLIYQCYKSYNLLKREIGEDNIILGDKLLNSTKFRVHILVSDILHDTQKYLKIDDPEGYVFLIVGDILGLNLDLKGKLFMVKDDNIIEIKIKGKDKKGGI